MSDVIDIRGARRRMIDWRLPGLSAVCLLLGCSGGDQSSPNAPRPVPVRAAQVLQQDLQVQVKALGTVTPLNTVVVRSRVDGELVKVLFEEGQSVQQGQLLAQIDARPFEVALAQAQGAAQEAEVELRNSQSELQRFNDLLAQNFISRQQVVNQEALVSQLRARVVTLEAAVDSARLQLSYTRIQAPIAGRLGLRRVDQGNLLRSGDEDGLVSITQTQPISVSFTVPETQVPDLLDAYRADERLPVQAWDRSETRLLATGTLASVDNQIDTATGTLRMKAQFDNEDEALFPMQFVNVRLQVSTLAQALVIPGAAVQFGSQGNYVYVIGEDQTVSMRAITLGAIDGERMAVIEGLQANEWVVLEGLDRLRDGRQVQVITGETAPAATPAAQ